MFISPLFWGIVDFFHSKTLEIVYIEPCVWNDFKMNHSNYLFWAKILLKLDLRIPLNYYFFNYSVHKNIIRQLCTNSFPNGINLKKETTSKIRHQLLNSTKLLFVPQTHINTPFRKSLFLCLNLQFSVSWTVFCNSLNNISISYEHECY